MSAYRRLALIAAAAVALSTAAVAETALAPPAEPSSSTPLVLDDIAIAPTVPAASPDDDMISIAPEAKPRQTKTKPAPKT